MQINAKGCIFGSNRPMFIQQKISKVFCKLSRVLKKSLHLVEDTGFNRTFVPETSRNKGVDLNPN